MNNYINCMARNIHSNIIIKSTAWVYSKFVYEGASSNCKKNYLKVVYVEGKYKHNKNL